MKKVILLVAIILIVSCAVSIPLINNLTAKKVEKQLLAVSLPEHTTMIESVSATGKLVGNGNGMQYFGAMLIKSELTLDELSAYYAQNTANVVVKEQQTQKIECVEHQALSFDTTLTGEDHYYIVYLFGDSISPLFDLDIRGH